MFCRKCKSLLFPKDGMLVCNMCGYQTEMGKKESYVTPKKKESEIRIIENENLSSADGDRTRIGKEAPEGSKKKP
jgi:DNA-directed RNA polymerase subunit M